MYIVKVNEITPFFNPFGAPIFHDETVSSTFESARILAAGGAPHGTVFIADFQESGRGRFSRPWKTERGESLLFTLLLRYKSISEMPAALTLRTGLAAAGAVEDFDKELNGKVFVKWPNDIMLKLRKTEIDDSTSYAYRKVSGILSESDGKTVYIGVGLNVAQKHFPLELRHKAASLQQALSVLPENARFVLLESILSRLYRELFAEQGESPPWHDRLNKRLYKKGEIVSFAPDSGLSKNLVKGVLKGVGAGGELLIMCEGEKTEKAFVSGELQVY